MIVLDTNVLSETLRRAPSPEIMAGLTSHPISQLDAMIAAIAQSRGATLATRNSKDFNDCGVEVINPWDFAGS